MLTRDASECVVSLFRTGYVHQVSLTDPSCECLPRSDLVRRHQSMLTVNLLGDDANTFVLLAVENCAGVVCGCLPTLLPIWSILRHGRLPNSKQQTIHTVTSGKYTGGQPLRTRASRCSLFDSCEEEKTGNDGTPDEVEKSPSESYRVKCTEDHTDPEKPMPVHEIRVTKHFQVSVHRNSGASET